MSIRIKILLALGLLGVISILATGRASYRDARAAFEAASFERLTAVREGRARCADADPVPSSTYGGFPRTAGLARAAWQDASRSSPAPLAVSRRVRGRRKIPPAGLTVRPLVAGLLCVHAALAITSLSRKSATFDEMVRLTSGYSYWVTRDYRLDPAEPVYLSYFGTDNPERFGIEAIMLPSHMPWRPPKFETLTGRIYCISATMLQLMYVMPTNEWTETYEARRQYERVLQYDPTNVEALRAPAAGSVGPALLTIQ